MRINRGQIEDKTTNKRQSKLIKDKKWNLVTKLFTNTLWQEVITKTRKKKKEGEPDGKGGADDKRQKGARRLRPSPV